MLDAVRIFTKGGVVLELAAHEAVSEARPPPLEVCPPCVTGGMPAAPDVGLPPRPPGAKWPPPLWPLSFKYGMVRAAGSGMKLRPPLSFSGTARSCCT